MKVESHSIEEKFVFRPKARKTLAIIIVVGLVLFGLGCYQAANEKPHHDGEHKEAASGHNQDETMYKPVPGHSKGENILIEKERKLWAKNEKSNQKGEAKGFGAEEISSKEGAHQESGPHAEGGHGAAKHEGGHEAAGGHAEYHWTKRLYANLWINNVFFGGLAIVGVFFYALQFAASAGWSAGLKRVPMVFGNWLPIAGVLMVALFFLGGHDIFHWTHDSLYDKNSPDYDEIIEGKRGYLNTPFFIIRTVLYYVVWYIFFKLLVKEAKSEDINADTRHYVRSKWISAFFIIFFAVTNSTSSWDWVMSIDTHWFSTMFGWYYFAALFVSTLSTITLIVVYLKENGYLSIVNQNHLHDLGKFVFAFSIFYTYVWFGQFFLIYYANIPEETFYYMERLNNMKYAPVFFLNIFLTFVLPFLLLMTRDAKRQRLFLKIVCYIVIVGQWLNFWLMVTPGTLQNHGGLEFMELGLAMVFAGAFLMVVLSSLSKIPLIAKNHPMLQESIHHHI